MVRRFPEQSCDFDHDFENGNTYRKNFLARNVFPIAIPKEDSPPQNAPLGAGVTVLFFTKTEEGFTFFSRLNLYPPQH